MKSFLLLIICFLLSANDSSFIYGKITLRNGDEYQGTIRWGKDYGKEHFWFDTFDSSKLRNQYSKDVDRREYRERKERGIFASFRRMFRGKDITTHVFECHFGDIKLIEVIRGDRAEIVLKNDDVYEVSGGDIGEKLYILDDETGHEKKLDWYRIETIEFMETPKSLEHKFGKPLYGTVETEYGTFEGFVQWDYDESLLEDELDGDERDFLFTEITEIIKESSRSVEVVLKDGRTKYLSGTNDVDRGNRGIAVKNHELGKIEIDWDDFISFKLSTPPSKGFGYSDFKDTKKIRAEITLDDGEKLSGRIAFDLDETYDIEFLNGDVRDIKYFIPFRNVSSIEPFTRHKSVVELKSGVSLELSESQDVSYKNDGILIWTDEDDKPVYKKWRDIKHIKML